MKKWICLLLCLALGSAAAEGTYLMTEDEMRAIWQESFDKMGTEGWEGVKTLDDLPAFEKEYTERTGYERKDDLVFSSLPMEGDMPYAEALAYAKKLLLDKFPVTEAELDAMGVYPRLVDEMYTANESEWEFYFTPRRDTDINLDHEYGQPGEYRVCFGAQSGAVEYVNWYVDGFFPDYAQKTWDFGNRDYVYMRANRPEFYNQPLESQAQFIELLTGAGYEMAQNQRMVDTAWEALGQLLNLSLEETQEAYENDHCRYADGAFELWFSDKLTRGDVYWLVLDSETLDVIQCEKSEGNG